MASGVEGWIGFLLAVIALLPAGWTLWKRPLLGRAARRSARGHIKQGITVALTASVATAVVAGALVVGDSMEALVDATATEALPGIDCMIRTSTPLNVTYFSNLFTSATVSKSVKRSSTMLSVPASITCGATGKRDSKATLYGFHDSIFGLSTFWKGGDERTTALFGKSVAINRHLAEQTGARVGDDITIRVPNPGFWGDFLFRFGEDAAVEDTYRVRDVFDDVGLGRLDLEARRTTSSVIYMSLDEAQSFLGVGSEVNTVLFQYKDRDIVGTDREDRVLEDMEERLDRFVGAEGLEMVIQRSPQGWPIITTDRIFLPGDIEEAMEDETMVWSPTLTYFTDSVRGLGQSDLAYSTVAGIDFAKDKVAFGEWRWNVTSPRREPSPGSNEALINNWTAGHLGVGAGDTITVGYTVVDDRYELVKRSVDLVVVGVVDVLGKAYDPALLPPIPGVHDAVSCLNWEPPFPIDLETIEEEDVEYWNMYRGTPKVWIDLGTARELWTNPDGDWTGARYIPRGGEANASIVHFDGIVTAGMAGISIEAARADALATSGPLAIFEQMFLFFGAVLLLAGCLLEASAFANLARSRLREHATLRALGLDRGGLVQVMLLEGTVWGGLAAILGIVFGAALGSALVGGLNTFWADAVESTTIPLAISGGALWLALGIGLVVTVGTLFLASRRAARLELPPALSDRSGMAVEVGRAIGPRLAVLLGCCLIVVPAVAGALLNPATDLGGLAVFFSVGTMATIGGALASIPVLGALERRVRGGGLIAPWRMGLRSLNRRPGRALLLVGTFALVSFAVIGISWAGEIEISHADELKQEQTGGYDILAETYVPVGGDLKDEPGAPPGDWTSTPVKLVGYEGGTCSNLNARFPPRVMGMPDEFLENVTVGFRSSSEGGNRETWLSLGELTPKGRVPVVVDYNTLVWIYGGRLGEVYEVDGDRGRVHEFVVVGIMDNSIFAGSFITGVDLVDRVYPDSAAFTYFLIDSGSSGPGRLSRDLESQLGGLGLDARPTDEVVRENVGYELSFLRLFQVYLALGLVVGALGLGALALREVRERRREIGAMRALGWARRGVWMTFLSEQVWFAGAGVIAGIVGAAFSILATSSGWFGSLSDVYVPGGTIATIALLVLLAAAAGAFWAARDAAKVQVADALRSVE